MAGRLVQAESVTHTLAYTYNGDGVRVASAVDGAEGQLVVRITGWQRRGPAGSL
jgi:hypothetical protein